MSKPKHSERNKKPVIRKLTIETILETALEVATARVATARGTAEREAAERREAAVKANIVKMFRDKEVK